ncbi:unnamed protein product [Urochloa decumbens]|uniref:F-box domain-containing protein n=1 Tax=Urochloa decumbens TaxID=240449 RepID=A0ABC9FMW1_9POAL
MFPPPPARRDPAMDPPPPPALMDELVEEILIRVPPDDPATLVRAALVCKRWCRLIAGASFRRRFRELHPRPPMLGFLYQRLDGTDFVPASSFRPPHAVRDGWCVLDALHGRVLVLDAAELYETMEMSLIVWDPVTDDQQSLPIPQLPPFSWNAALLCVTAGCDHLDCRGGPFPVLQATTVVTDNLGESRACAHIYSSEQGAWSERITVVQHHNGCNGIARRVHGALVGNAICFNYEMSTKILEYDLGRQELSTTDLPSAFHGWQIVLMEADDGVLGFAIVKGSKLCLWAREAGVDRNVGWAQRKVIELDKLLPVPDYNRSAPLDVYTIATAPFVVAVADGIDVIFLWTDDGLFSIHLKSSRVEKIGEFISDLGIVPYMSFCTPALDMVSTADEGPRVDASSTSQT